MNRPVTIWRFADPVDPAFAEASGRGAWSPADGSGVCSECSASRQHRVSPLRVAWVPGSDLVGDFVWPVFGIALARRVAELLVDDFTGWHAGPVELVEDPDYASSRRKRVGPLAGADFVELLPKVWVESDGRSSVTLNRSCHLCGHEEWSVAGVQRMESSFDSSTGALDRRLIDREAGQGIYVRRYDLAGASIFGVNQFPLWRFCTDLVRLKVLEHGFTNVAFLEMGEVIEEAS